MFSHRTKKRGQQHYWLPPLSHVTRVMWPRRTWQLTIAVVVILTGLAHEGPGHWSEARGREEATVSHIKSLQPPTLKGTKSEEPEIQYGGQTEVTHTDGRTPPRACFSACTLCTEVQLTSRGPLCLLQCHRALQHVFRTSITLYKKQPWQGHLPVADRTGDKRAIISRTKSSVADLPAQLRVISADRHV